MIFFQDTKRLTNEIIDQWSHQAEAAYKEQAGNRADRELHLRLTIEEILLRFQKLYGTEEPCQIKGIRQLWGIRFELSQPGVHRNPLSVDSDLFLPNSLLIRLGVNPQYLYRADQDLNIVTIPAPLKPRKNAMLLGILLGAVLAVLTWLLAGLVGEPFQSDILLPLVGALFGKLSTIFSALATPLVFCAVVSGIYGIGDVNSFGKLGGRLFGRMMLTYGMAMLILLTVGLFMGMPAGGQSGGEDVFSQILNLVLNIIPGNLVEPFRIDNDLQVITIAIFVGVVMLILGDKVSHLKSLMNNASSLFNQMMLTICQLLPFFVYLGFTNLLLSGRLAKLSEITKVVVLFFPCAALTIGITLMRTLIVTKKPFQWLFSAQLPSLLINLTTSSQVSALPESMKCCKEKWGINEKFADFGLPLGIVIYMPNGAIMLAATGWVFAAAGGTMDPANLGKLLFVAIIVAIAAPPIPGSAFAVLPIIFSTCGIDSAFLPLSVVVASTCGYLLPAMNGYCLQLELLMCAWKSDMMKTDCNE